MPFLHVEGHFRQFLNTLDLETNERLDAEGKAQRVATALHARYYPTRGFFNPSCYQIVGSYGKNTAAKPRTDIDMIFVLPADDLLRIEGISGNKQSYLLQEVKQVLLGRFPNTDIRGDGPVVKIPFQTYEVELVPCFATGTGQFLNAHTKNGGRWAFSHPAAELDHLNRADATSGGMARHLVKMLKAWQRECNVEVKSICLEIAAVVFVEQWLNRDKGFVYYDFLVRDFFAFLLSYTNPRAKPAGIDEWIDLGPDWPSKGRTAYDRAVKACEYEQADDRYSASFEWRKIFGSQFPLDTADISRFLTALSK